MLLDCIFCKIINKTISSQIIAETKDLLVIKDAFPRATIHYLILPKKHFTDLMGLEPVDAKIASEIIFMAQDLSRGLVDNHDFRLVTNNGISAGQSVFHLHFHFLSGKNLSGF